MTLTTSLKKTAHMLPLVFMVAANANADPSTQLERGCRDKEQVSKELEADNQAPLVKFFIDGRERGAKDHEWVEVFYTTDLKTGNGYKIKRSDNDKLCVSATTSNTRLFNNQTLDERAYLDAPNADKKGIGINNLIYGTSINDGENPMLRVVEYDLYLKTTDIKYLLARPAQQKDDPRAGEGSLVAATLDGKYNNYSKGVPAKGQYGAPHGAEYTNTGKLLLGVTEDSGTKVSSPQ